MVRMPPSSSKNTRAESKTPAGSCGTAKVSKRAAEIELACVMQPMPNEASTVLPAKKSPNPRPSRGCAQKARRSVYIGPPHHSPRLFFSRYLTASRHSAYFVAMPNSAEIHIQTSAPGPPAAIAVATPTRLPVPTVAASAVIKDENGEISPGLPPRRASLPKTLRSAAPRLRQGRNRRRNVKKTPVPKSRQTVPGPHTKWSILCSAAPSSSKSPAPFPGFISDFYAKRARDYAWRLCRSGRFSRRGIRMPKSCVTKKGIHPLCPVDRN